MRYPAVAGKFYPASASTLEREVTLLMNTARSEVKSRPCLAVVVPHAGYIYSGLTAAYSFAACEQQLKDPKTVAILIGPNHTGLGNPLSVSFDDWKTPIGVTSTDLPLAGAIVRSDPSITKNEAAHLAEHSIEVQLPFLQVINPQLKIVALCMGRQDWASAQIVGNAIFSALRRPEFHDRKPLLIASSDFTHYESGSRARQLDAQPLEFIKALDGLRLEDEVAAEGLSICGHGPISAVLHYCKKAGAQRAELLRYTNSGLETDGDERQVVAYAAFAIV